jgi:hypothetical protein
LVPALALAAELGWMRFRILAVKKICVIDSYFADMMMMIVSRKYALHETSSMGVTM